MSRFSLAGSHITESESITHVDVEVLPDKVNSGQFQPGQSGNPNGRPKKGKALTDIMERKLESVHPFEEIRAKKEGRQPRLTKDLLVERLITAALTGDNGRDLKALAIILDRIEGVRERKKTEADAATDMNAALGGILDKLLTLKKASRVLPPGDLV